MPIYNPPVPGSGGIGDVIGPASATDNAVVRWDTTTGKLIQNSGVIVDDSNNVSGVGTLSVSGTITNTVLTASQAVVTDSSKNLTSLAYSSSAIANNIAQWDANVNFKANNLIRSTATTATSGGTTTLTAASAGVQQFTGTSSHTVQLPNATTLRTDTSFIIIKKSTGAAITIRDAAATTLVTTASDIDYVVLTVTDPSTAAGVWNIEYRATSGGVASTAVMRNVSGDIYTTNFYGASFSSNTANIATSGALRLAGTDTIQWRNNANSGNLSLSKNTSDVLLWAGTANFTNIISTTLGNTDSTQADARFTTPVTTITSDTTLGVSHWGKRLIFNSASALTITLPQQSTTATVAGVWFEYENIGAGTITFIKQGVETLNGNTSAAQYASGKVFRDTTTSWIVSGGTATVTQPTMGTINLSITTSNTKDLWYIYDSGLSLTLLGIRFRAFSVGTAGTFKLQLNGVDISGLTGLVPSTTQTLVSATSGVLLVAGDVITIVADGTLATIADLNITPNYTATY